MGSVKIYHRDGNAVTDKSGHAVAAHRLTYNDAMMGESSVTLSLTSSTAIGFSVGDYLTYRGHRYVMTVTPSAKKQARGGTTGDAMVYNNVKFVSVGNDEALRREFRDEVLAGSSEHHNSAAKAFTFYCESVFHFAEKWKANMDKLYEGWKVYVRLEDGQDVEVTGTQESDHESAVGAKNIVISISNETCWDSLSHLKEDFGIDFIMQDRILYIGAEGNVMMNYFRYGKGNGLFAFERTTDESQSVTTRMRCYGSEKNMPMRYYQNMEGSMVPNNMNIRCLMLPGFGKRSLKSIMSERDVQEKVAAKVAELMGDAGFTAEVMMQTIGFSEDATDPYVDSIEGIGKYGIREGSVTYDGNEGDEIYPSIEYTGNNHVFSADYIEDNGIYADGEDVPPFHIRVILPFNPKDYIQENSDTFAVGIQDGYCGGRTFTCDNVKDLGGGLYDLRLGRDLDTNLDLYFPYQFDGSGKNGPNQIRGVEDNGIGDKFILSEIMLPDEYIEAAALNELLPRAIVDLINNCDVRYKYSLTIDNIHMARQHNECIRSGKPEESIYGNIKAGDKIIFYDEDLDINEGLNAIVIENVEIVEEEQSIPRISVTLADELGETKWQSIQRSITNIVTGKTPIAGVNSSIDAEQVRRILMSIGDTRYMRRDIDTFNAGTVDVRNNIHAGGHIGSEEFVPGPLGTGWRFFGDGSGEVDSLSVRKFIETPEMRYNKISVKTGVTWKTFGAGLIEDVTPLTNDTGIIRLKLEEGEYGAIAVDDLCMGIFHNEADPSANAKEDEDQRNGNFHFAGHETIYFRVEAICDEEGNTDNPDPKNRYFIYRLREVDDRWRETAHPKPAMSFACYANPNNTERQNCVYSTTGYEIYLENMTNWTYGPDNIYLIIGELEGFSVWAISQSGKRYLKALHGQGTMLGKVYMYETIDQFERLADHINLSVSPYVNADYTIAEGETMTLKAQMVSYSDVPRTDATYRIVRSSSDASSDAAWNARRGNDIANGSISLTTDDTKVAECEYDPAVQFTIIATRILPSAEGGDSYSVERDIVLHNVGSNTLTDDNADPMIALGEAKHYNFLVTSARGADLTPKVTRWKIERKTEDEVADALWATRTKVKNFTGSIDLVWSDDPSESDMDPNEEKNGTKFIVTAYVDIVVVAQEELII